MDNPINSLNGDKSSKPEYKCDGLPCYIPVPHFTLFVHEVNTWVDNQMDLQAHPSVENNPACQFLRMKGGARKLVPSTATRPIKQQT